MRSSFASLYSNVEQKFRIVRQVLTQSEAIHQSVVMSLGSFATSGLMGIAIIVAARVLGPAQFGIFSVLTAILFIASKATDLGIHQLVPRLYHRWQNKPQIQKTFAVIVIRWKLVTSLLFIGSSLFLTPLIAGYLNIQDSTLVLIALLGGVFLGWYELIHLALSSLHKFSSASLTGVLQSLIKCVGFLGIAAIGLLFSVHTQTDDLILRAFVAVYSFASLSAVVWQSNILEWVGLNNEKKTYNSIWASTKIAVKSFQPLAEQTKTKALAQIKKFLPHAFVGTIAMVLLENIDILLISAQLNAFEVGIYSGASKVAMVLFVIMHALSPVLTNRITRYNTAKNISGYLKKSLAFSAVTAGLFICFLPFSQLILTTTIGQEYRSGLVVFILLVANAFLSLALVPYASFFFKLEIPWANSVGGVLQLGILFIVNAIWLNQYGIIVAAIARLLATISFLILSLVLIGNSWKNEFTNAISADT